MTQVITVYIKRVYIKRTTMEISTPLNITTMKAEMFMKIILKTLNQIYL